MRKFTLLLFTLLGLLGTHQAEADHLTSKYLFAARMDGMQEVPMVTTNAVGLVTFYVSEGRDTICIRGTFTGLSGAIEGAHIHEAPMGMNGGVVLDLDPYITGNRIEAVLTGSSLTPAFIATMFNKGFYVNIHTAANPNGEIRGQIVPEADLPYGVKLTGLQQVPPVMTLGTGLGFFWLAKHNDRLSFNVTLDGLSSPITGVHLHEGPAGVSGGVVKDLDAYLNGNSISGSFDTITFLSQLINDSIYINVHTVNNPNGEVRGQLTLMPYVYYDGALTGSQQVPPVATTAIGEAVLKMNHTFDTLWYDVQTNGLSGAITDAHFHLGSVGTSGGVVVGIPSMNIVGNVISGYLTGVDLQDSFVHRLNEGAIYINIHTAANPNGEIRAQLYKTFREGYTFKITGDQEVPAVSTMAEGSGMVSIDRDQTNAHYMAVTDGLTPTMIHFHNQVAGQNGGVIYDLMGSYNNGGLFGYWRDVDMTTPFTTMMSNKFRKDSVYINYHTMANMNGEIRGNSMRTLCLAPTLGLQTLGNVEATIDLYPNPAHSDATLDIVISDNVNADIQLVDMMGRNVWNTSAKLSTGANRVNIPLGNVAAGIYFVKFNTTQGNISYKLVKE